MFQLFFKQNSMSHILSEGTLLCIIVLLLLCATLSVFARSDFERRRGSLRFGLEQFVSLRRAWHYVCPRKPWKYSDNSNIKWDTAAPLWHLHIWYCSLSNLINLRLYVKKIPFTLFLHLSSSNTQLIFKNTNSLIALLNAVSSQSQNQYPFFCDA